MSSAASLLAASTLAALCACGARAGGPAGAPVATSAPATSLDCTAAPPASTQVDRPRGRQAAIRVLDWNGQRTYWVEHCPTDSTSPLREPCSMTRVDPQVE